ncbi:GNAT family N-acetyltransferase [Streptomyces sp. ACA25]|uniref:GNAT family N-acetyltransferase n=1 Tax=Streptomyces sp. ACA25 TaxID=3022596 RepID=UPI00230708EE|nr:GNAT family N-acetyltransferase [Streptomyces sp. ACA25]MDB1089977.1 GNAT family N-acetyltransferase [Streptomyces sp. ACA25]
MSRSTAGLTKTTPTAADPAAGPSAPTGRIPTGLRLAHYGADEIARDLTPWAGAYERVHADALHLGDHSDPPLAERLGRHTGRPGFSLVAALDGNDDGTGVAGFVYGYTLPEDTAWWRGVTPDPGPEHTREYPGRTVAVCELLVDTAWRRSRVGAALLQEFLAARSEERAAALVAAGNEVVLGRYARYGFTRLGITEPYPGWRPHAMIVRPLRPG